MNVISDDELLDLLLVLSSNYIQFLQFKYNQRDLTNRSLNSPIVFWLMQLQLIKKGKVNHIFNNKRR